MKKTMINKTHIEGYVYEHKLELKVSGPKSKNPGTQFIAGTLSVATDEDLTNVIPVHFTYVTAVTSKGAPNMTFNTLNAIIDGKIGSVMEHGAENAGKVRIDSALDLNEWFDARNNDELVSIRRNEGGFVHQIMSEPMCAEGDRATFDVDFLINEVRRIEEDAEKEIPEKVILKGYIFNFRKSLLPIEFTVLDPNAMNYFEGLGVSKTTPVFTQVRGIQVSQTVTKVVEEESAFGKPSIKTTKSSYRDFVITWGKPVPYDWDSEDTILASEMNEGINNREIYLADIKKRRDEYQASKDNAIPTAAEQVAHKNYKF